MADEGNEDSWLYGNEQAQAHFGNVDEKDQIPHEGLMQNESMDDSKMNELSNAELDNHPDFEDAGEDEAVQNTNADSNDAESSDDDDINVVIGDIKSGPSYNIKQRQQVPGMAAQAQDKPKHLGGKFNIEEFESVGTINGAPAHEFNIESIEDKPWRKPGADITDYFNYGFNEDTWRAYCERQKKMRVHESGVGLASLAVSNSNPAHDNKYPGIRIGINRPGQMSGGIRKPGAIDVIGGGGMSNRRDGELGPQMIRPPAPKENIIQVMTADRREYSRTVVGNKFDIPPPAFVVPEELYHHENDAFNYGYEPTQDSQWGPENPGWQPSDIKELTPGFQPPPQQVPPVMGMPGMMPGPGMPIPGMRMPPPMMPGPQMNPGMHNRNMMHPMDKDRERDDRRDRDKNDDDRRRYDRDRERERRDRDRSPSKDRRERGERGERVDRVDRDRERRDRERKRERSRSRERSSRRERSRDRERSSRRETSKERTSTSSSSSRSKDKKKSHKKDKEEASD